MTALADVAAPPPAKAASDAHTVLAVIDGEAFTAGDLALGAESLGHDSAAMLRSTDQKRRFLDELLLQKLAARQAAQHGLAGYEAELERRLAVARTRILAELYRDQQIRLRTSPAAVRARFDQAPERWSNREVRAEHIVVATQQQALALLVEAKAPGVDFAALLRLRSAAPVNARGGDLGWFSRGRMLPEFEKAAFALPKGAIYPAPIQTPFGWHILRIVDVRGDDSVRFEDVHERIAEELAEEAREKLRQELLTGAKIEVDEQALRGLDTDELMKERAAYAGAASSTPARATAEPATGSNKVRR